MSAVPSITNFPTSITSDDLTIRTGGQILGGWLNARTERNIEALPSGFALEATEFYPGSPTMAVCTPGSTCQIYLGNDLLLTGYIDIYAPNYDATNHITRIEGRSKTEDIVDCSLIPPLPATVSTNGWYISGQKIGAVAQAVCKPFGINVSLPQGDFSQPQGMTVPINAGETVFELLEYLARTCQVLLYDDPNGNLVVSRVGTVRAGSPLVEGVNCEVVGVRLSMDQRYSKISAVGQQPQIIPGADNLAHLTTWYTGTDSNVPRYRPLLVVMDQPGQGGATTWAQLRVQWELARRIGRSRVCEVSVQGWRDGTGKLWTPNTITNCTLPTGKINNEDMIIGGCSWLIGDAGKETRMVLMPPAGFTPQPYIYVPPLPGP